MNHCLRHYEEPIAGICRACDQPFCTRCLVFSFGPKKPPYCLGCALHASGIRNGNRSLPPVPALPTPDAASTTPEPAGDRRMERARRRAEREAIKVAEKAARKAARTSQPPIVTLPATPAGETLRTSRVPAPSQLLSSSHAGSNPRTA
ncbi:hypothetical protein BH10ACT1_BH10ACT1_29230 [soil metagenome]